MTNQEFLTQLSAIVGIDNIYSNDRQTEYYRKGFRSGEGDALAVIFPTTLLQQWQVLKACHGADKIMIMQAANTGLTEGSTPSGSDYDRDIVIINTTRMTSIYLLDQGKQILSFPGATLHSLEQKLKPVNRAPHSVIGSSCIGASIVGGVANNSGGALVKRGPAYTELALYARIDEAGELELVNHLGINNLGNTPEEILTNLEQQNFTDDDLEPTEKLASDKEYTDRIREIDEDSPARYNADSRRLYEASGCAGKLAVFAVRLDTYPVAAQEQVFYIGTNDSAQLTQLRRDILSQFENLPEVAEYMHRDAFNIAEKYGKDVFLLINYLGTEHMPKLFALKGRITASLNKIGFLPKNIPDKVMQIASQLWKQCLPERLLEYRDRYEHHLILKMSDDGIQEAERYLADFFVDQDRHRGAYFRCSSDEAKKAYLHRFAAAGAAIRYQVMHEKEVDDILALDIALRRNDPDWVEKLPTEIKQEMLATLYYGHFLCHVFHQDYIVRKGANTKLLKQKMLELLEDKGAKYPAEHNVGHLYQAEQQLGSFYQELDPTNTFNPGVGKLPKHKHHRGCC